MALQSPARSTPEALLDAAEALFSQRSYADVGIREIAERAGANIASIKYHFGSKKKLYLESVRRTMTRATEDNPWAILEALPSNPPPSQAATALCRFIRAFLQIVLRGDAGVNHCASLLVREGLEPTEAIDVVFAEYIAPNHRLMLHALAATRPDAPPMVISRCATSIVGQMLHYLVFRPFVERLRDEHLGEREALDRVAEHVASFSLRGLGCDERLTREAMDVVFGTESSPLTTGTRP